MRDLPFHAGFVARALAELKGRLRGPGLRVAALLFLWQMANAAGFVMEAVRDRFRASSAGGSRSDI